MVRGRPVCRSQKMNTVAATASTVSSAGRWNLNYRRVRIFWKSATQVYTVRASPA